MPGFYTLVFYTFVNESRSKHNERAATHRFVGIAEWGVGRVQGFGGGYWALGWLELVRVFNFSAWFLGSALVWVSGFAWLDWCYRLMGGLACGGQLWVGHASHLKLFGNSWGNSYIPCLQSNNGTLFYLWWNENLARHRKVSKYYETYCKYSQVLCYLTFGFF